MVFKVGETVVYPHHGAALIEAIETRTIKGEERKYLVLKVAQGDLTVRVPAENAEVVGVRDVVGQEGLDRVFEVLRAPHTEEPTNWSRRYKANLEKLASGDVNKVAEVVRDLWRREKDRGLSAGEKRMLAKARQILVSELALAEGTDEERAELLLDEVLATATRLSSADCGRTGLPPPARSPHGCHRGGRGRWPYRAGGRPHAGRRRADGRARRHGAARHRPSSRMFALLDLGDRAGARRSARVAGSAGQRG